VYGAVVAMYCIVWFYFLLDDMEKRMCYCGGIVCVQAVVPCIVLILFFNRWYGEKNVLLRKYSVCTSRRAMYSLILFLLENMVKRMCYCRSIVCVRGRRGHVLYSLILFFIRWYGEKNVLLRRYSVCTGRRAMYSLILFLFVDWREECVSCYSICRE
jgi:hypothetical protein